MKKAVLLRTCAALFVPFAATTFVATPAAAQETTSTISGTVTAAGAPVPNATVGSLPIYTVLQENLALRYRTGPFRFTLTGGYQREDFANTVVGGTPIKESTLDANATNAAVVRP